MADIMGKYPLVLWAGRYVDWTGPEDGPRHEGVWRFHEEALEYCRHRPHLRLVKLVEADFVPQETE